MVIVPFQFLFPLPRSFLLFFFNTLVVTGDPSVPGAAGVLGSKPAWKLEAFQICLQLLLHFSRVCTELVTGEILPDLASASALVGLPVTGGR